MLTRLSLQTVIISRFLINLRRTLAQAPEESLCQTRFSTARFHHTDFVSDIGQPLDRSLLEETESEAEEADSDATVGGPDSMEDGSLALRIADELYPTRNGLQNAVCYQRYLYVKNAD